MGWSVVSDGKCTNSPTVAEHSEHKENTRFIPFILESSGVYGEEAQRFMREVSQWAFDEGFRPDHFEENMRRSIGMALTRANTRLVIRDIGNTRARNRDARRKRYPRG